MTSISSSSRIGGVDEFDDPSTFARTDRENGRPFFSRRVGLSESGEQVGIDYGGKLTGRIGRWDFGVLNVRQDRFGDVDRSNLFVGRAAMKVLKESSLGVILTNGHPTANLDNSLAGADFRYLNTRLPNGRTIEGAAWYQQSDTEGLTGKDAAYGASLHLANTEFWRGAVGYKVLEENFNPALGFVDRVGVRNYSLELGYRHRPSNHFLRSIYAGVDAQRFERLGGGLQSQSLNFRLLELENHAGDSLQLSTIQGKENVAEPFAIHRDIIVPPGTYNNDDIGLYLESGPQRPLSAGLGLYGGSFYGGDILTLGAVRQLAADAPLRIRAECGGQPCGSAAGEVHHPVVQAQGRRRVLLHLVLGELRPIRQRIQHAGLEQHVALAA